MWLSDKVLISDTDSKADYPANGYRNHYASVKVSVYGDFIEKQTPYNYMTRLGTEDYTFWSSEIDTVKAQTTSVNFVSMYQNIIDTRYDNASIKADVTDTSKDGSVKAWLENDILVNSDDGTQTQYYTMYIASEGITFFSSDSAYMFYKFSNLVSVNFDNINTSQVTDMSQMFYSCTSLPSLDVSSFDTSSVTNMSYMFFRCSSLTSLDVSSFDTSQVSNMYGMFYICSSLPSLYVSNFNTSKVTNMVGMFGNCSSLTSLDVSNFDTSQVTDMMSMFSYCPNLTSLDLSNFDTNQVTDITHMFYGCTSLTSLDLTNFDISKVTDMRQMFYNCSNLITIYANSDWNTGKVTNYSNMFSGCTKLVGAISYNSSKVNITYANPTTGYFTKKTI